MGLASGMYKLLKLLHILVVIFGLGSVSLNALYGREARLRRGPGGLAITEANLFVTEVATYIIYLIPVTGILLVMASDKVWSFSDVWVWLSLLLWVVGVGISHGVMKPTVKKMIATMKEMESAGPPAAGAQGPPPQVAVMEQLGARLGTFGPVLTVLLIVIVALMIWKPGS